MHFSHIAITSLLASAALAKPMRHLARQEADTPSVPDLGPLPLPTGIFPGLTKRQSQGVDPVAGLGNRVGGPTEGTGNGNGSGGVDDGEDDDNNGNGNGQGNRNGNGNGNAAAAPPPPPPPPAAAAPPMQEPPMQQPPPPPQQTAAATPPPAAAPAAAPATLPAEVAAKMMQMVWNLGPITQLKPGLGVMDNTVLPKINNVDSKAS
ncbi:uncharacterized protein HMPREF1541_02891 [Cyphellophora europaea CBS 101466]|uniref:Uncharacterized protein n=1 Tax=Cyphellophora europaea (strain CBS 101466) TaxID=1220924 RepID=W2S4W4_CYPE1|nr:uncharacterized protein HMPREF1541_02891 [Cyphellophora europaea CBS 101466]ETN43732.1 hypothetical protein HMPREF1541_02891 [Cyphellophora europaea CBS 101466]